MKILDGIILAQTKNRTHRIRNSISVIISSLLFGVLFFGALFVSGMLNSAEKYQDFGFNKRYLTIVLPQYGGDGGWDAAEGRARSIANKDLESRGIKVTDEITESEEYRNHVIELTFQDLDKQLGQIYDELAKKNDQKFHPSAKYEMRNISTLNNSAEAITNDPDPLLTKAKDATEKRTLQKTINESNWQDNLSFNLLDNEMAQDMLSDGQSMKVGDDGSIPIFMPYKIVSKFSSVKIDKKGLSTAQINQKYRELFNDVIGKTVEYCYRNDAAKDLLIRSLEYNYQLAKDKSKETPITINDCAPISDKRLDQTLPTDAEIKKPLFPKADDKQQTIAPITKTLRFRISGIAPYSDPFDRSNIIFSQVNIWPSGTPMIIPSTVANDSIELKQIIDAEASNTDYSSTFYDFENRADQKRFIASGCQGSFECGSKPGDLWIQPFGNVRVALEMFFDIFKILILILAAVTVAVAMFTTMAIIGKTIGESRREIAIFRALGARRRDIAQIYVGFGLILTFRALLLAFVMAVVAALILSYKYANAFNAELIAATGAYTSNINSSLIGFDMLWLLAISGALIMAALLGLILPIAMGTRRKLINQLREE
ncbi:FtsX-like permease family protein [Candidatus Saccharibacteria bacterium]|nr:FtsX-like permease family protein [Candidatus Saccharibacteria bacterium]